ncbi:DUF2878 domain-containing protein [Neptunomonas qingdaonensis]|uniref:DUF2878 domain-containing protein n=1 Tax=Neptunomonas qingdaonensis TaxID=1045558 RepID=A0A1I2PZ29_9GAMM|nr:DUF2878 domain-containing protein [Neptunomonas qingdaonensis]SFG20379.1 Protein of unknown function [Neptunomonas qingdaonensis]
MLFGLSWKIWINFIGFNLIWVLSIFSGNESVLWVLLLLLLHFLVISKPFVELSVVLATALIGYSVDCLLTLSGVFRFEQVQGITPVWLILLWIGFCSTLRHSLSFFSEKYLVASVAGAIAGSITYLSAAHFGAVELPLSPVVSVAVLASVWAFLFPALLWISFELSKVMSKRLCL